MTLSKQLDGLKLKGQERERLTKQLAELVGKVCDAIATTVPPGTEVTVGIGNANPLDLAVYRFVSNVGDVTYFTVCQYHEEFGEFANYVVTAGVEPGGSFYLHGDFGVSLNVADRDTYLLVANRLPEILAAFEAKEEEIVQALREGFEKLRKLAGE